MKKPDRFSRVVEKLSRGGDDWALPMVHSADVVAALRKEHRWVERMVESHDLPYDEHINTDYQRGYFDCVNDIFEKLKQRRK